MTTLEKIKAELHATAEMHEDGDYYLRDKWVDEVIDKYAEQEPTEDYEYEIEHLQKRLDIAEYDKERLKEKIKALEQEPCEDVVSRQRLKKKLQEHHDFFVNAYGGFKNMPQTDKARVDEITNCIAEVVNAPSVRPQERGEQ